MANTVETTTEPVVEENIFSGLTDGFQKVIDFILYIINTIRDVIESIVGK